MKVYNKYRVSNLFTRPVIGLVLDSANSNLKIKFYSKGANHVPVT